MKKFLFLIIVFCFTFQLYGQRYAPEFYLWIKDVTQYSTHIFDLELISPLAYCYDANDPDDELFECDDCGSGCDECEGGTESIYVGRFTYHQAQKGFGHCAFETWTADPWFGYGVYKLTHRGSGRYIYLDIRDDRYLRDVPGKYGPDFWVRYDGDGLPGGEYWEWTDDPYGNWNAIELGEFINIWELEYSMPTTGDFPAGFWANCLTMTYNTNGNPRIVWGRHPSFSPISGYKIYRATDLDENPETEPDPGDYSLLETVNSSTLYYVDDDVKLDELGDAETWYYVRAYHEHPKTHNITYSADTTNSVVAWFVEFYKPFVKKEKSVSIIDYKLNQNYPNPFNPTTNISFDLPEESSVQLQIYDIQGKLVSTLVNETMDKGNHSVSFNSDGLPSGVYFYRLSTKNFTNIKRMLLLK